MNVLDFFKHQILYTNRIILIYPTQQQQQQQQQGDAVAAAAAAAFTNMAMRGAPGPPPRDHYMYHPQQYIRAQQDHLIHSGQTARGTFGQR